MKQKINKAMILSLFVVLLSTATLADTPAFTPSVTITEPEMYKTYHNYHVNVVATTPNASECYMQTMWREPVINSYLDNEWGFADLMYTSDGLTHSVSADFTNAKYMPFYAVYVFCDGDLGTFAIFKINDSTTPPITIQMCDLTQEQCDAKDSELILFTEQNNLLNNQIIQLNIDLNNQISEKKTEISSLNNQINLLVEENADREEQISQLNDQINEKESEILSLNEQIMQLNNQITQKDSEISEMGGQLDLIDIEIAGLNSQITGLNNQIGEKETEISSLNNQINILTQENADREEQISQLNDQINDLNVVINELNNQISELETQIQQKDLQISQMQSNIEDLNIERGELNTQVEGLNDNVNQLTADKSQLETAVQERNTEISQMQSSITDLNSQISTISAEKQLLTDQLGECSETVVTKDQEISSLTTQIESLSRFGQYVSYLSLAQKRGFLCDYMKDNNVKTIVEFGVKCDSTYVQKANGRWSGSCKCKKTA